MNGNDARQGQPEPSKPGQGPQQPTKPSGRWKMGLLTHTVAALVGLVVGLPIGLAQTGGDDTTTPSPTVTKTVTETAPGTATQTASPQETEPNGPASKIPGDGVFLVGEDIKPGTYRTAGPAEDSAIDNCYWERAKDASGEVGSIIANDNTKGPGRVTVNQGEVFKTNGCEDWELVK